MCGGILRLTQMTSVYMIVSFPNYHELSPATRPSVVALSQGPSSYVYNTLKFSVSQDLAEVGYQLCQTRQRDYQLRLLMLSMHAGMDMPLDPKIPCTYVSPAGEAIVMATCSPTEVRILQNDTCFVDIPVVTMQGEHKFMELPSMKLVPETTEIPCGTRTAPLVEERGMWYSSHLMVNPRKAKPLSSGARGSPWMTSQLSALDTRGIYRAQDIKRLRAALEAPGVREAKTLTTLKALAGSSVDRASLSQHLEAVQAGITDAISNWMFERGYVIGGWFGQVVMICGILAVLMSVVRCLLNLRLLGGKVPVSRALVLATSEAYTAVRYFNPVNRQKKDEKKQEPKPMDDEERGFQKVAGSEYLQLSGARIE